MVHQWVEDVDQVRDRDRQRRICHLNASVEELLHEDEFKVEGLKVALDEQSFRNLISEVLPCHATDLQMLVWVEFYHAGVEDLMELSRHIIWVAPEVHLQVLAQLFQVVLTICRSKDFDARLLTLGHIIVPILESDLVVSQTL